MNRPLKHLLLWLLIAALPLQGLAAAMRTSWASAQYGQQGSGHAVMHQQHAVVQPDAAEMHDHQASMETAHAMHTVHSAHDHAHHQTSNDGNATPHKASSCSACATCCIGMSMPFTAGTVPAAPASSKLVILAPELPPAGITLAGLERPPKILSA